MSKPVNLEVAIKVETFKGELLSGRIQMPGDSNIYKFLNQPQPFFLLKTDLGRTLLVNKQYVVKIEPVDPRAMTEKPTETESTE